MAQQEDKMILLDRYLFKQFTAIMVLVLTALLAIYLLVDFFERIDDFMQAGKPLSLAIKYLFLKIPLIIEQLTPITILLGGVIALGLINHHGELIAIKAAGTSTFRITVPIMAAAVSFTFLTVAVGEWLVPPTTAITNKIMYEQVRQKKTKGIVRNNRFFYKDEQGFYSFEKLSQEVNRFDNFSYTSWDNDYTLQLMLNAEKATWQDGRWVFENSQVKKLDEQGSYDISSSQSTSLPLPAKPADFFIPVYKIDEMPLSGLFVQGRKDKSFRGVEAHLKFLERFSFILLGIPLLMLGLPILLIAHKRWGRDLSVAIPVSCGLAFGAWGLWGIIQSFAKAEIVNPYLAALAIHLLIGSMGTYLILGEDR
jgi:lipopolysaccharide export system permease protein